MFIIKAGVEMMLETLDDIISKRRDKEAVKIRGVIKNIVMSHDWALKCTVSIWNRKRKSLILM